ncbi:MAG: hypothetical protein ABW034_22290 [Steroidobacteraceae bacterium]
MRPIGSKSFIALLVAVMMLPAAFAEDQPVQAIWKRQEIDFFYQSFTTFYTCDGLEDRVETILRAVGAKDVKAIATGCFGNAPSRTPHVKLVAKTPMEATPEALAELEKDKSTRELKARVRGERPEEVTAQFPATWKPVNLSVGQFGIDSGECELIEELTRKVFPKLSVRVVKNDVRCTPHQANFSQPRLQVEALTALPKPDDKKAGDKG